MALKSGKPGIYNIGTGKATSINYLATLIKELTSSNVSIIHEPPRLGDIK